MKRRLTGLTLLVAVALVAIGVSVSYGAKKETTTLTMWSWSVLCTGDILTLLDTTGQASAPWRFAGRRLGSTPSRFHGLSQRL